MMARREYGAFPRIVEIMLPRGGVFVALLEAYFDESIGFGVAKDTGNPLPILCVAGYIFDSDQARALCDEWQAVLAPYNLPYFHMVDCAHGSGVFAGIPKNERASIAARMIGNIKRRAICGIAAAVNIPQFEFMAPKHPLIGSPYSFCVTVVLAGVSTWINKNKYEGDAAYFFEAGHKSRNEANFIMEQTFDVPELKADHRYVGHAFVDKAKSPPVQAADLLAWQFYTSVRRQTEGTTVHRKDFASLIEHPHQVVFITPSMLADIDIEQFGPVSAQLIQLHKGNLDRQAKIRKPKPINPSYEGR